MRNHTDMYMFETKLFSHYIGETQQLAQFFRSQRHMFLHSSVRLVAVRHQFHTAVSF